MKSLSKLPTVAPCSSAKAARCASFVRLPAVPATKSKRDKMPKCRSPGCNSRALGCNNQSSAIPVASATDSGLGRIAGCVDKRIKPINASQAKPTPDALSKELPSHEAACLWCGLKGLTEYKKTLVSGNFMQLDYLLIFLSAGFLRLFASRSSRAFSFKNSILSSSATSLLAWLTSTKKLPV